MMNQIILLSSDQFSPRSYVLYKITLFVFEILIVDIEYYQNLKKRLPSQQSLFKFQAIVKKSFLKTPLEWRQWPSCSRAVLQISGSQNADCLDLDQEMSFSFFCTGSCQEPYWFVPGTNSCACEIGQWLAS